MVSSLLRMLAVLFFGLNVVSLAGWAYFQTYRLFYDSNEPRIPILQCPSLVPKILRTEVVNQGRYCQVTLYNWARTEARGKLLDVGQKGTGYSCTVPLDEFKNDEFDKLEMYSAQNPIVCNVKAPCSQVQFCAKQDGLGGAVNEVDCPRGPDEAFSPQFDDPEMRYIYIQLTPVGASDEMYIYYPWNRYRQTHFTEFCDSGFTMAVGKMLAMRALIGSVILLSVLWFFVDMVLTILKRRQVKSVQSRLDSFNRDEIESIHNRNITELVWMNTQIDPRTTAPLSRPISRTSSIVETPRSGMVSRVITPVLNDSPGQQQQNFWGPGTQTTSFKVAVCNNPFKAFTSLHWYHKVRCFNENFHRVGRGRSRVIYLSLPLSFLLVGFILCVTLLALTPGDLVNTHSIADVLLSNYSSIWRAKSTWIILPFLFLDELYEIGLFLIESLLVRWGTETVFAQYAITDEPVALTKEFEDEEDEDYNEEEFFPEDDIEEKNVVSDRLIPEGVVAVICVDGLRLDNDDEFITNIQSVISVVGIEKVFILQFSDSLYPLDDTPVFLQSHIALGVQYVFVPERDERAAVYWFSKYYIPLVQVHQDPLAAFSITHVMVVEQGVSIPPTFVIPHQLVIPSDEADDETGKEPEPLPGVICFASRNPNGLDNLGLQFEIMHASFLSDRSSLGDTEMIERSGVVVWERDCLEKCAFTFEPLTAALGGDAVGMGIEALHIKRPIKFVHNNLINRFDKKSSIVDFEGFLDKLFLVHGRRKRLVWSDVKALLSPAAVLNRMRLAEKPFAFHNFLRAIFDSVRLPVLIASGLRDPVGLAAIIGVFIALMYVKLVVLWVVIERSPAAAKKDRPNFFTALYYPIHYVLWELVVLRPLSVFAGLFWSLLDTPDTCLAIREDYEQNLPPCLPYPDAPWYSIWIAPPTKCTV